MFVVICHSCGTCLIRILHVNNSKQSKYQTTACSLFCAFTIYTLKVQMCYETFVLICHHGGTGLIRLLCPKQSKKPTTKKTACSLFFLFLQQVLNVLCVIIYICLKSCTAMVSHLLPFMADITLSHCFEYISMAIALHG